MCESRSNPRLQAWLSNNKHNVYSRGDQKVLGSYLKHYNQNHMFPILLHAKYLRGNTNA